MTRKRPEGNPVDLKRSTGNGEDKFGKQEGRKGSETVNGALDQVSAGGGRFDEYGSQNHSTPRTRRTPSPPLPMEERAGERRCPEGIDEPPAQ